VEQRPKSTPLRRRRPRFSNTGAGQPSTDPPAVPPPRHERIPTISRLTLAGRQLIRRCVTATNQHAQGIDLMILVAQAIAHARGMLARPMCGGPYSDVGRPTYRVCTANTFNIPKRAAFATCRYIGGAISSSTRPPTSQSLRMAASRPLLHRRPEAQKSNRRARRLNPRRRQSRRTSTVRQDRSV
jgi:hypothetical protein